VDGGSIDPATDSPPTIHKGRYPVQRFFMPAHLSGVLNRHQRTTSEDHPSSGRLVLDELQSSGLLLPEDWDVLPITVQEQLLDCREKDKVLELLVEHKLLTIYQAARISAGTTFGLVLGNYRILDRIGAGGMAVVFKGEHRDMRNQVAIKVLPMSLGQDERLLTRFFAEMRVVAQLRHPNIVAAIDAGKAVSDDPDAPVLRYFVMEYVPGMDLEDYVRIHGSLGPAKACNLAHQIACALAETHKYKLVHRDIKPSNVLVTAEEQAKLLDFGLTRHINTRLTQPGTVLGTLDFMAPEQARDASTVDIRADLYGLGGTLYWCLTGRLPFPVNGSVAETLLKRLTQAPPSPRQVVPEVPADLDALVQKLMAVNPDDRYPTPQAVMRALLPFLNPPSRELLDGLDPIGPSALAGGEATRALLERFGQSPSGQTSLALFEEAANRSKLYRILIIDDEPGIRDFCKAILQGEGMQVDVATDGIKGLQDAATTPYDLVLLDVNMPAMPGLEVLRRLREKPPSTNCKIMMFSGATTPDELSEMLLGGADDFITKPFSVMQFQGRIKAALRLKDAQDRSTQLNHELLKVNAELEKSLSSRNSDLVQARNALVLALAKLVQQRDDEPGAHLLRLQRYCRVLGEAAVRSHQFANQIDEDYLEMLECCAPLHDIGKVGLPDHILLKPGKLTSDERILMQAHTIIGAETLRQVAEEYGVALAFLQMAIDIARHHHERFDGTGYPDRLVGNAIPLAARMVAVGDVYDALRSRRVYKPALSHAVAVQLMTEGTPGHLDPSLLRVFQRCAGEFEKIFRELPD
jgi:response regulator RpfG family c-di-GMP phosphodiesterase/serine/threonine protein kinase